jgi:hypothetical protein
MTIGDVADSILATHHEYVFVCLSSVRKQTRLWFIVQLRETMTARSASLIPTRSPEMITIVTGSERQVAIQMTSQDEMVSRPTMFSSYPQSTPLFAEYRGGWAESTIQ